NRLASAQIGNLVDRVNVASLGRGQRTGRWAIARVRVQAVCRGDSVQFQGGGARKTLRRMSQVFIGREPRKAKMDRVNVAGMRRWKRAQENPVFKHLDRFRLEAEGITSARFHRCSS